MRLDIIAGARPNFVKIAAIIHALHHSNNEIQYRLVHTGQHYDATLSGNFFKDLSIPQPDVNLQVSGRTQAQQTANIMMAYEELLLSDKNLPDYTIVVGDVTSSMACAISAKKLNIKVGHVEAGLRSYDWSMPEEINRVLIDSISDIFFTTTRDAANYLIRNGKDKDQVHFVGNTMIDTLLNFRKDFRKPQIWDDLQLKPATYFILTLHRPGNVDEKSIFHTILNKILSYSGNIPVIFPAHPRTASILKELEISAEKLYIIPPLDYLEFNYLVENAKAVITDSGGITEETTVMGVPCMTLRENTERPETISIGSNEILGQDTQKWTEAWQKIHNNEWKKSAIPEFWDGKAGKRIAEILTNLNF